MPQKDQTNPHNDPEFDKKVKDLYAKYLRKCADDKVSTVPFDHFRKHVLDMMARMIATNMAEGRLNEPNDGEDVLYVAMRVADAKESVAGSTVGKCSQCQADVLLDPKMGEYLKKSKAVICNQCLPEVTGQTFDEAADQELKHYNKNNGEKEKT